MISKSPKEKVPLTRENLTKYNLILDDLFKLPCASDFIHPVDYQELFDYPSIVKTPMDLSTVKSKLNSGKYLFTQNVRADISLIWSNCKLYNVEDSGIYRLAIKCQKHCKNLYARHFKKVCQDNESLDKDDEIFSSAEQKKISPKINVTQFTTNIRKEFSTTIIKNRSSDNFHYSVMEENDITDFKTEQVVRRDNGYNKFEEAMNDTDGRKNYQMLSKDKLKFIEYVKNMDGILLAILMRELQKLCPQVIEEDDEENIQIRFDKFDSTSFEQISKFADNLINKK